MSERLDSVQEATIPHERMHRREEEVTLRFYQMPKALFGNSKYKGLSLGAKAMYSILRDRQDLSLKNNWVDDTGYIYLVFDIDKLAELIEMNRKTVMAYKKELVEYGLLIDKRIGQGEANRMYVLKPELVTDGQNDKRTLDIIEKSKKRTSRSPKNGLQEVRKMDRNDTEFSDTEFSDTKKKKDDDDDERAQKILTIVKESGITNEKREIVSRIFINSDVDIKTIKNVCTRLIDEKGNDLKGIASLKKYVEKSLLNEIEQPQKRKEVLNRRKNRGSSKKEQLPELIQKQLNGQQDQQMDDLEYQATLLHIQQLLKQM